jgi:choline dehydrogenase-like flavoprotein
MERDALVLANRYSNFRAFPAYNWQYKSAPQKHLNDRQIDYSRGRGLGGTSRINFACYTIGPKGDFDHWAELVGDNFFNWQNARRRYNTIESFDTRINPRYKMYADPTLAEHGSSGPVLVSFPETWERGVPEVIQAFHDSGVHINPDLNSGDPIGWSICPSAANKGMRTTGATAYLKDPPTNLTIITDSVATKVILEGKRAVGVVSGGKKCE